MIVWWRRESKNIFHYSLIFVPIPMICLDDDEIKHECRWERQRNRFLFWKENIKSNRNFFHKSPTPAAFQRACKYFYHHVARITTDLLISVQWNVNCESWWTNTLFRSLSSELPKRESFYLPELFSVCHQFLLDREENLHDLGDDRWPKWGDMIGRHSQQKNAEAK